MFIELIMREDSFLLEFRGIYFNVNKKKYVAALEDETIEGNVLPKWRGRHGIAFNFPHLQVDWFSNKREFHSRTKGTAQPLRETATWHAPSLVNML